MGISDVKYIINNIYLFSLLALSVASNPASAQENAKESGDIFSRAGFTIKKPSDWSFLEDDYIKAHSIVETEMKNGGLLGEVLSETESGNFVFFARDDKKGEPRLEMTPHVEVEVEPEHRTPLLDILIVTAKKEKDFQWVEQPAAVKISGIEATGYSFTATALNKESGREFQAYSVQLVIPVGKNRILISLECPSFLKDQLSPVFNQIIKSIQIRH